MRCFCILICLHLALLSSVGIGARACRVDSELLTGYTKETIERLLDIHHFESLYWPDEPLSASSLARATGINVTLAETHFHIGDHRGPANQAHVEGNDSRATRGASSLIQDIFVTCSVSRDRSYALSINLELDNPFKSIDLRFDVPQTLLTADPHSSGGGERHFRMSLPQSSLLVQLSQSIKYDECLTINYVQLAPSVSYEIECNSCSERERAYLDNAFNKRMTQFDAQLDALISEKFLFGLQVLLNQQRLELDS